MCWHTSGISGLELEAGGLGFKAIFRYVMSPRLLSKEIKREGEWEGRAGKGGREGGQAGRQADA